MSASAAAARSEEDPAPPEDAASAAIDKLYNRLEKTIARIRDDTSDPELLISLRSLFALLRKINEEEEKAVAPGETHEPLTLSRIYQLASSGAGGNAEELQEANAAFAEENQILTETIQSLSFQIEALRGKAADEILGRGDLNAIPLDALRAALDDIRKTMADVEEAGKILTSSGGEENPSGKGLDERFAEAIGGYDDISPEMLKIIPGKTTLLGRILRRAGFAYDHKDLVAVRHLVATVLKVNHDLTALNETLAPAREQIERIHQNLTLVEALAGHEERQGPQYIAASEEIDRLRSVLSRYEGQQGSIEKLDQELAAKRLVIARHEDQIDRKKQELADLQAKKDEMLRPVREQEAEIDRARKEADREREEMEEEHQKQVADLTAQLEKLKDEHRSEVAAVLLRIHDIENGLLVEKLEAEVQALRNIAQQADEKYAKECEERIALDSRIAIWVKKEEDLEKKIAFWQKAAAKDAGNVIAISSVAALGAYVAGGELSNIGSPMKWYFGLTIGVPAVVVGGITFFAADNDKIKNMLIAGGIAGFLGGMVGAVGSMPISADQTQAQESYNAQYDAAMQKMMKERDQLLAACKTSPCQLVPNKDGKGFTVLVYSEAKAGKRITFDFSEKGNPRLITDEPVPKPPEEKKEQPAAAASSAPKPQ
jgi:hypothetical protein